MIFHVIKLGAILCLLNSASKLYSAMVNMSNFSVKSLRWSSSFCCHLSELPNTFVLYVFFVIIFIIVQELGFKLPRAV